MCLSNGYRRLLPFGASQTVLGFAAQNSAASYQLRHPNSVSTPYAKQRG